MTTQLQRVLGIINKYQYENNITKECLTNVQIIFQYMLTHEPITPVIIKPVIAVIECENNLTICTNHVVIEIDNNIIDTSYEYNKYSNVVYYENYNDFIINTFGSNYKGLYTKKMYERAFNEFGKISAKINKTKKIMRINNKYYDLLYTRISNILN